MKTNAIIRIIIYSIIILLLLSILGGFLAFDRYAFQNGKTSWIAPIVTSGQGEFHQEEQEITGAEPITHIEIAWTAGTITIQPGDTNRIQLSESGTFDSDEAMVCRQQGSKLMIEYQERDVFIGIYSTPEKDLTITVPRDWQGESIEIDAAAARLEMRDIAVRELDFDSASGEGIFEHCAMEKLDIDTASGDIHYSGTLDTLRFEAMSAKLTAILENNPGSLNVDTMSGDVDITLPAHCGFTASVDAMSSDFTSDFDVTNKNDTYLHGDGSCRITVSAMSGDVTIRRGK